MANFKKIFSKQDPDLSSSVTDPSLVSAPPVTEQEAKIWGLKNTEIKQELLRLKDFAAEVGWDGFKNGSWLDRLIRKILTEYTKQVDYSYFERQYPNKTINQIADLRIAEAAKAASIAGGITATTCTGAALVTIGSAGSGTVVTLPAGILAFTADLTYTTYLHLRLAYDLSVLYQQRLDVNRPQDLARLINLAFPFKTSWEENEPASPAAGDLAQGLVKQYYAKNAISQTKNLPIIGKILLRRKLSKVIVPVAAIPIAAGLNYRGTKKVGKQIKKAFQKGRII